MKKCFWTAAVVAGISAAAVMPVQAETSKNDINQYSRAAEAIYGGFNIGIPEYYLYNDEEYGWQDEWGRYYQGYVGETYFSWLHIGTADLAQYGYTQEQYLNELDATAQNIMSYYNAAELQEINTAEMAGIPGGYVAFHYTDEASGTGCEAHTYYFYNENVGMEINLTCVVSDEVAFDLFSDFDRIIDGTVLEGQAVPEPETLDETTVRPEYQEKFAEYQSVINAYQQGGENSLIGSAVDFTTIMLLYDELCEMDMSHATLAEQAYYRNIKAQFEGILAKSGVDVVGDLLDLF